MIREIDLTATDAEKEVLAALVAAEPDLADGSLVFEVRLRDTSDAPLTTGIFRVQYFDIKTAMWEDVVDLELIAPGHYRAIMTIENIKAKHATRFISAVERGNFPEVRLITAESAAEKIVDVVSFGGNMAIDPNTRIITYNFAEHWYTAKSLISDPDQKATFEAQMEAEALTFRQVAVMRPSEKDVLYPAMLAAVSQPETFKEFDPTTDQIVIKDKCEAPEEDTIFLLKKQVEQQQNQLDTCAVEIGGKEEVIQSQSKENETLRSTITEKDHVIAEKEAEVVKLQEIVDAVQKVSAPAEDVYTKIVQGVEGAATQLQDSQYSLSNISLNIKTHVVQEEDGIKLQLVDAATALQTEGQAISDFQVEIAAKPVDFATKTTVCPKVTGLTETAARQRLNSLGLKLKAIYQASQGQVTGQGFKQVPEAGADIVPNDVVTVIFAKNEGDYN